MRIGVVPNLDPRRVVLSIWSYDASRPGAELRNDGCEDEFGVFAHDGLIPPCQPQMDTPGH
jgi:hypothetical protein